MAQTSSNIKQGRRGEQDQKLIGKRKGERHASPEPETKKTVDTQVNKKIKNNQGHGKQGRSVSPAPQVRKGRQVKQATPVKDESQNSSDVEIIDTIAVNVDKQKGRPPKIAKIQKVQVKQTNKKNQQEEINVESSDESSPTNVKSSKGRKQLNQPKIEFNGNLEAKIREVIFKNKNSISINGIESLLQQEYSNISVTRINQVISSFQARGVIFQNQNSYSLVKEEFPQKPAQPMIIITAPPKEDEAKMNVEPVPVEIKDVTSEEPAIEAPAAAVDPVFEPVHDIVGDVPDVAPSASEVIGDNQISEQRGQESRAKEGSVKQSARKGQEDSFEKTPKRSTKKDSQAKTSDTHTMSSDRVKESSDDFVAV